MASSYAPLHLRSNYSLGTGTARIEEILKRAAAFGIDTVALTDTNNLYGAIPFYKAARRAGITPIIGCSLEHASGNAVLLARDCTGYSNICRIITELNLKETFDIRRALRRLSDGLFVITKDIALAEALQEDIESRYLVMELAYPGRSVTTHRKIHEFARFHELAAAATGDVYFLDRDDYDLHRAMLAIRDNSTIADGTQSCSERIRGSTDRSAKRTLPKSVEARPRRSTLLTALSLSKGRRHIRIHAAENERRGVLCPVSAYFASPEEMRTRFRRFPDALENTLRIAEECRLDIPMGRPIFPRYPLPPGETPRTLLTMQCAEGLRRRYAGNEHTATRRKAKERIRRELDLIQRLGFSEYFIIVADIARYAKSKRIPMVGRGSGASSIVSYVLGITDVDPIAFNLPFERFLNIERTDCPDIDVDFCWRMRDDVIDYVYKRYGSDYVAMISTHTTFRKRGAFREMAKVHGVSNSVVNRVCKKISWDDNIPLHEEISLDEKPFPRIVNLAERIVGFPRSLNIHCGGVVIGDRPIYNYVPLEKAPKGIVITQYEMRAIEDIGLVKIDLLGNRALSAVRESLDIIGGSDASPPPDGDPKTIRLLQNGKTLGCCQLHYEIPRLDV
ncbi:PHP domain-containing protein, partial [Planctomycetota bacterium]